MSTTAFLRACGSFNGVRLTTSSTEAREADNCVICGLFVRISFIKVFHKRDFGLSEFGVVIFPV